MSKSPDFIVWHTYEITGNGGQPQTCWMRVGAAFRHKNGPGLNISLTPGITVTTSKLVLLEPGKRPGIRRSL